MLVFLVCGAAFAAFIWSYPVIRRAFYVWRYPPIRDSVQHGGELVADVLSSHGVTQIFTLVGGHISPILAAAEKRGLRVIDTRHEATAVFAADATARLSGGIGVAVVTAGPGLTNTVTAVQNARMAESPLLLLSGAAASLLRGRGALQDIDQLSLLRSVCKSCVRVQRVREIVPSLMKAIQTARSDNPGPVLLEFPIDTLYPYNIVRREVTSRKSSRKLSIMETIVAKYIHFYVDDLFAGAWDKTCLSPLVVRRPIACDGDVRFVSQLLSSSHRPLLLVGGSALQGDRGTVLRVRQSLENIGLPCYLTGGARGVLGASSEIQFRHDRRAALREADFVMLLGVGCDFRLDYGRQLSSSSRKVIVHRCSKTLKLNTDLFWKPSRAVCADVADFICRVSEAVMSTVDTPVVSCPSWWQTLRKREAAAVDRMENLSSIRGDNVNSLLLLKQVEKHMSDDAIVVVDGGDFAASAAYTLRPRTPLGWLDPGTFGTLGVGAGFALSAALLYPQRQVWLIYGDGACGYSVMDLDTFRRHNVCVIAVVGNDACWTQIYREQINMFGTDVACSLVHTRYDTVAQGLGAVGILLENNDDITKCLDEAVHEFAQGNSVLINAVIDNNDFRAGSISV